MILLAMVVEAWGAAGGCTGHTAQTTPQLMAAAHAALDADDVDGFWAAHRTLAESFSCQQEVLSPRLYAQHLMDLAIVQHHVQLGWDQALYSALLADPTVRRPQSRLSPLATWQVPTQDNRDAYRVPDRLTVYLDGRQTQWLSRGAETHFIQVDADGVVSSAFVEAASPAAWLVDHEARSQPAVVLLDAQAPLPRMVLAGGASAAAGLLVVGGSWLVHRSHGGEPYDGQPVTRAANISGWGLVVTGGVLAGVGWKKR